MWLIDRPRSLLTGPGKGKDTGPDMAHRLYSYQGKDTDWRIKDPRLSLTVLFLKWETWIKATRTLSTGQQATDERTTIK